MKKAPATTAKRQQNHITPRHSRLIDGLLNGPLPREKFGLSITTERVEKIDRDGLLTRPGVYHLSPESREHARLLLALK